MPKKLEKIIQTKMSLASDTDAEKNEKNKISLASDANAKKNGKNMEDKNKPGH
jgi:hypothetical protein